MEIPSSIQGVEGLSALDESETKQVLSGGRFALPANFPADMSSMWQPEGPSVMEAQQPEVLQFAGVKANGWAVFKVLTPPTKEELALDKDAKPKLAPYKRAIGKTVYVLLMRPRKLQHAVNRIYANQSRTIVNREVDGETKAVDPNGDPGILSNQDIKQFDRITRDQENAGGGYLKGVGGDVDPNKAVELNLV